MSGVKSISLDDDELPNPIGIGVSDTQNKAMHYSPAYAAGGHSDMGVGDLGDGDDGTVRRGGKFHLSEGLTRFTQVLGGRNFVSGSNGRSLVLASVFGLLLAGAGAYMYLGEDYLSSLFDSLHSEEAGEGAEMPAPELTRVPPKEAVAPEAPAEAPVEKQVVDEIPGNPYWKLPNPVPVAPENLPAASQQQSETWRAGLNHPFTYQRYKTTQDLRRAKVDGAVSVLYEALAQGKFWTRMEALLGIADNGVAIDNDSMRTAIGDARSDLVKNYFKRFRTDYTMTTAHVMRQALRVVDGRARFIILWNLSQHRGEINDQYLYAALQGETDPSTKAMVQSVLERQPVPKAFVALYDKAMSEEAVTVVAPRKKPGDVIKVDKIPANMNVEEVYFINEEAEQPAEVAAPVEEVKEDDGFNDLQHSDEAPPETSESNEAQEAK